MTNPIVVEVLRGERVESAHRGAAAVMDAAGRLVFGFGDVERPVYPRSAVKALQALPLIESGAAERLGLTDAEVALAVASHSGEPEHVAIALGMLAKAGATETDLGCGAHWPLGAAAARELAAERRAPTQAHNNCSGKHAGFLCLAAANGWAFSGYVEPGHPVQRAAKTALEEMTEEALDDRRRATDGCSIPTYAVSLTGLARAFAKLARPETLPPARAAAAARIFAAVRKYPHLVAGAGRFDTDWMRAFGDRSFTKTGAEGVFCAALPEAGLGIAVKADDGAGRAAEAMVAALMARYAPFAQSERATLARFVSPKVLNWAGRQVGALRPAGPLAGASGDCGKITASTS